MVKEIRVKFKNGDSIRVNMKKELESTSNMLNGDIVSICGYDTDGAYIHVIFQTCDVLYIVEAL